MSEMAEGYEPMCYSCPMNLSHPVEREDAKRIARRHRRRFGHLTGIEEAGG